jgi:hypothetical protein
MSEALRKDVLRGLASPEQCPSVFSFKKERFRGNGRRINNFMVGADPEFMFLDSDGGYVHATRLGLLPALAYGSDQNTRLVEMRATPSTSTFEVTASILSTLRWMYRNCERSRDLTWRAGAFCHGDGIGGHVHLGRRRPTREHEVRALDRLARAMRHAGLFPSSEWETRASGDQFGQRYGRYGDIRAQKHGYEYRTLPSWLTSPKLAFLVLTLSKLAVVDPEITMDWICSFSPPCEWERLRALAKYYKGRDDDAWMLYTMMADIKPFLHDGSCFRERWGLTGKAEPCIVDVLPAVIAAQELDRQDLKALFLCDEPLVMRSLEPNWIHRLPANFFPIIQYTVLGRHPNAGDVIWDVIATRIAPGLFEVQFQWSGENDLVIALPQGYKFTERLRELLPDAVIHVRSTNSGNVFSFSVGRYWRTGLALSRLRKALHSGLFPIWKAETVTENSRKEWDGLEPPAPRKNVPKSAMANAILDRFQNEVPRFVGQEESIHILQERYELSISRYNAQLECLNRMQSNPIVDSSRLQEQMLTVMVHQQAMSYEREALDRAITRQIHSTEPPAPTIPLPDRDVQLLYNHSAGMSAVPPERG